MVNLKKGQKVDLTKGNEGLNNIMVGLGWDTNKFTGGDFDLDSAVFMTAEGGKCKDSKDFIYYGNLKHISGGVIHLGDNLTGAGDGDDEVINVVLDKVPQDIEKLVVSIAIYQADSRNQNFGMVDNAFIRIVNNDNKEELIRYDLSEDFSTETAITIGELYRHNGEWKFTAVGGGFEGGFEALTSTYGV